MEQIDGERWAIIPGFERYAVSDAGRVVALNYRSKKNPNGRRVLLRPARLPNGYLAVGLRRGGASFHRYVHRLVLEAFVGPCPPGHQARHLFNPDRTDNRLANLAWGTRKENAADRTTHGSECRGSRKANARLTEAAVADILRLYHSERLGLSEIGRRFGQSRENVLKIVRRQTWRHVPMPAPTPTPASA